MYAPFHAGVSFPVMATEEAPGATLHLSHMTLFVGNATYADLGASGVMRYFALGSNARVCFSNM